MTTPIISEAARMLGKRGGAAHKKKYGRGYYRTIAALGGRKKGENARRRRAVDNQKDGGADANPPVDNHGNNVST